MREVEIKPEVQEAFAASPLMQADVIDSLLTRLPTMPKPTAMLLLRQLSLMFETCPEFFDKLK